MGIYEVKDIYEEALLAMPGVVGLGVGHKITGGERTDQVCLTVYVRKKLPLVALAPEDVIPAVLPGAKTDVIEAGVVRASISRTDEVRPAPPGVSIGYHEGVTAGTFGFVARDNETGFRAMVSNYHVMVGPQGKVGGAILQPGLYDGGENPIALLARYVPVEFTNVSPCPVARAYAGFGNFLAGLAEATSRVRVEAEPVYNEVDCALALPLEDGMILDRVLDVGVPSGVGALELGRAIIMSGRTSGLTGGEDDVIQALDVTIQVNYGGTNLAWFRNQVGLGRGRKPGDSGTLVMAHDDLSALALFFAGSDTVGFANPISLVLAALDASL